MYNPEFNSVATKKQVSRYQTGANSLIKFTPEFISARDELEDADGGGSFLSIAVSKSDQFRLKARRIELNRPADAATIERGQQLSLTFTGERTEDWNGVRAVIREADADIIPFVPKFYTKIDGIPSTDCRALENRFGSGFVVAKAHRIVKAHPQTRVGLVATNSIKQASNRGVLTDICADLSIYEAWSDEPWTVEGAAVRVAIICFANSKPKPGDVPIIVEIEEAALLASSL